MSELALAFFWHQHQPYYPDDVGGQNPMPWVRLHGVKDYCGMALHLLEFPEMRCTINLVPSLLVQIQAYVDGKTTDRPLEISRIPAGSLSEADCLFLLDNFFMANPQHMIRPFARYHELYLRRATGQNTAREALRRFKEHDLRDLQVWFNLAWVHPLAVERDPELREMIAKGRLFSEEDKNRLLDKHLEIMREIIPLHRKLMESGQVELTTTPFYHPILPLLLDKKLAREAMPDVKLPRHTGGYPEDAAVQVRRAVEYHTRVFGKAPIGMWPAEGSVAQPMIPLLADHGLRWIATDEEILCQATQGFISRDNHGLVRNPELLYRPYKVKEGDKELSIVFRDHALSDMIGFHYQRSRGEDAAEAFLRHLHNIRQAIGKEQTPLVSVILDGENCWEHYPDQGVPFLRALYRRCTQTAGVRTVKVGEHLEQHPPHDTLPHLFAGSWINHNFHIWIGHEEDVAAWDALHRTREYLRQRGARGEGRGAREGADVAAGVTSSQGTPPSSLPLTPRPSPLALAWEEMYIAEGSDWFWWYGDDHVSAQNDVFDQLFRKHLQNVYLLLGDKPPSELERPISRHGQRNLHSLPRAFLEVKVDGRETFFEWLSAGRYTSQNERGTMAMGARGPIRDVYFGFDLKNLFVRVDFDGPALTVLADFDTLRVVFIEPSGIELRIEQPGKAGQQVTLFHEGVVWPLPAPVEVGVAKIFEVGIPFGNLGIVALQPFQFYVDLLAGKQSRDRAPLEGSIGLTCPSVDFERLMWDV